MSSIGTIANESAVPPLRCPLRMSPSRVEGHIVGGELHQKGKEAPEPVLGVGAGVVVDTHHPQLRGLLGRSVGFLLTVCIFRIFRGGMSIVDTKAFMQPVAQHSISFHRLQVRGILA